MNKLPDELADLTCLLRLDISHNLYLTLPPAVFKMPKLRILKANNNAIIGEFCKFSMKYRPMMGILIHFVRIHASPLTNECESSNSLNFVSFHQNRHRRRPNDRIRVIRISRFTQESIDTTEFGAAKECQSHLPHRIVRTGHRRMGRLERVK